jgi:hypothetical protein
MQSAAIAMAHRSHGLNRFSQILKINVEKSGPAVAAIRSVFYLISLLSRYLLSLNDE